ncbi:MAG: exopolysaccharide biosynthesis protein, partial [Rhabdochlamydiaceae bacterium]
MPKALSNKVEDIIHFCRGRKEMTIAEFLDQLGTSGPVILTMIFSIPFLFLAWIPGLMMAFGVIIFISGIRVALNKPIWVHKILRRRKISGDKMAHRLVKWVKFFKKLEKTIHPRGTIYQQSP